MADVRYPQSMNDKLRTVYNSDSNKKLSLKFLEGCQICQKAPVGCQRI